MGIFFQYKPLEKLKNDFVLYSCCVVPCVVDHGPAFSIYSLPFLYMQAHEDVYEVVVCLFITKIGLTNPYYGTMNLWVS